MMENIKVAFFGTPKIAQIVLKRLIDTRYKPKFVVTTQDKRSGRGQKVMPSPVAETAQTSNLKIIGGLDTLNESFDLAILVAFGYIIPKRVLDIPKYGFINVHPSLLPKYRGPSPIQSAILAGEKTTGVSIMKLDEELDHGPILAQKEILIEKNDTSESLHNKLATLGTELLLECLPKYLEGKLELQDQNHKKATFCEKITKEFAKINIANPPAKDKLERMIRAYYPWPTVWTEIDGKRFKFLPEDKIQPEGKKALSVKEFSNGYPQIFGKIKDLLPNLG